MTLQCFVNISPYFPKPIYSKAIKQVELDFAIYVTKNDLTKNNWSTFAKAVDLDVKLIVKITDSAKFVALIN